MRKNNNPPRRKYGFVPAIFFRTSAGVTAGTTFGATATGLTAGFAADFGRMGVQKNTGVLVEDPHPGVFGGGVEKFFGHAGDAGVQLHDIDPDLLRVEAGFAG